jgi:hypothetical protein
MLMPFLYLHEYKFYKNRNMFIKNAVVTASKMLVGEKKITQLAN